MSKQRKTKTTKKRVFVIDDHPIVRHGITQLINQEKDLVVCGEAGDASQTLATIAGAKPDIVLLDVTLKEPDGLEVLKALKQRDPDLPVLILSIHDESLYAERMLGAGAQGYLMKQEATEKVLHAIRSVLAGNLYLGDGVRGRVLLEATSGHPSAISSPEQRLSDRELQVFRLIGQGRSTRDIARELRLSVKTVESHRGNIIWKLNLQDSHQLIQHAVLWSQRVSPG